MNDRTFTLRDLQMMASMSTPAQISLSATFAVTHVERRAVVERAIDYIGQEFTKTRQLRFDRSEDELSIDVVTSLKCMGLQASHDLQYGGHADIVVEMRDDFHWIGEAKIHRDYEWLLKGFQQLSTRYTTGLPGQDAGGLIIYCLTQDAGAVMDKWIARLKAELPAVKVEEAPLKSIVRNTEHDHCLTGSPFYVRHTIVPLNFAPQDKSAPRV